MPVWRRLVALLITVFVLASLGASARAQFGSLLKKVRPDTPAPAPQRKLYCQDITPETIEQLLNGLKAERVAHEKAQALEKAARSAQAAVDEAGAQRILSAMERQAACEQAAQEKDPRYREAERLTELRNRAQDRGDEAAADRYGEQYAALIDELEKMARKACANPDCVARAKADSEMNALVAELRSSLARERDPARRAALEAQITGYLGIIAVEAENKCSAASAGQASEAEQAASAAAAEAARKAREGTAAEGAKAANVSEGEYGRLIECASGALDRPTATPLTPDSLRAINQRQLDLEPALKAAGH